MFNNKVLDKILYYVKEEGFFPNSTGMKSLRGGNLSGSLSQRLFQQYISLWKYNGYTFHYTVEILWKYNPLHDGNIMKI